MALEQSFGQGAGSLPALKLALPESVLEIAGQIDRLDIGQYQGQRYVLVIDYKSGGAWLDLTEVYYGLKLHANIPTGRCQYAGRYEWLSASRGIVLFPEESGCVGNYP